MTVEITGAVSDEPRLAASRIRTIGAVVLREHRRMGRYERVLEGTRGQIFAAVYESAIRRRRLITAVSVGDASFSFRTSLSIWSGGQRVTVTVDEVDKLRCVVRVVTEARALVTRQLYDWGEGKRIAERLLSATERARTEPLAA